MRRFRPGVGFGDFVILDWQARKGRVKEEVARDYRRGWLVWLGVVVAFGVLTVRLVELQLFRGGNYAVLAEENRVRRVKVAAPRGVIYDRQGQELAANKREMWRVKDLGIEIERWVREYPLGAAAAHVVGYVGEVSEREVGFLKDAGQKYDGGDLRGRGGLEEYYEVSLRGVDGGRLVEVDSGGNLARELGEKKPAPGGDIKTTLDANLQRLAFTVLEGKKGAAVVREAQTGAVLALVSSPSFDPNAVSAEYESLRLKGEMPFLNRAIGGVYPPGSTFKIATTLAAIESGRVKPGFTFKDEGVITVAGFRYTNWLYTKRGGVEGVVGFERALARSTDTFFYKVGELTGPEMLAQWAGWVGLGKLADVDLPEEVAGLIATPQWKEETRGEKWFLGNTYHMAIGQGDVLVTPLQVDEMTGVVAAEGRKCRPYLARGRGSECEKIEVAGETLELVRRGMVGACSPGGTAYVFFDWNEAARAGVAKAAFSENKAGVALPTVACKTGTAEYVAGDGKVRTHGWLTAFAPAEKPEVTVTVVFEGGGEGSDTAAPAVRKILAGYFGVEDTYPYSAIARGSGE